MRTCFLFILIFLSSAGLVSAQTDPFVGHHKGKLNLSSFDYCNNYNGSVAECMPFYMTKEIDFSYTIRKGADLNYIVTDNKLKKSYQCNAYSPGSSYPSIVCVVTIALPKMAPDTHLNQTMLINFRSYPSAVKGINQYHMEINHNFRGFQNYFDSMGFNPDVNENDHLRTISARYDAEAKYPARLSAKKVNISYKPLIFNLTPLPKLEPIS